MKKLGYVLVLCALVVLCLNGSVCTLQAQSVNGTEQLPNRGFEEWDNVDNDNREPLAWNSFMTANVESSILNAGKACRISRESGGRPNSKGLYYLRVYTTEVNIIGIKIRANGTATTGRMNMGSTTPTDYGNHNYTDRGQNGFFQTKSTVPDSLVVWAWYKPSGSSDKGQISAFIHDDSRTQDPGTDWSHVVASAKLNPGASSGWVRLSAPFVKTGNTSDVRYALVSITSNQTPGGGSSGDAIFIDDMFFVYNPTLTLAKMNISSIGLRDGENVQVDVPFYITGTMSASTAAPDNEVIAELSDANGSFANPTEIGRITTDQSGNIIASIPSNTPLGLRYRIRVRSTNYPLTSDNNGKDIEIFKGYYISATGSAPSRGRVSGSNTYKVGTEATLVASANPGNHFINWSENGENLEGIGSTYTFTVNKNRSLVANFDTNTYSLIVTKEGGGSVTTSPLNPDGNYVHNTEISLTASAQEGAQFIGFYEGSTLLSNKTSYVFNIVKDRNITAKFGASQYTLTLVSSNATLGSVSGGGSYNHNTTATLSATPKPYCQFLGWVIGNDTVSKENPYAYTVTGAQRIIGSFSETLYTVSTTAIPSGGGNISGGGVFSAQSNHTNIVLTATPKQGYRFDKWTIITGKDTTFSTSNPHNLLSGRISSNIECLGDFSMLEYSINATAKPKQGGVIEGNRTYKYNELYTLKATPNEGYNFVNWTLADNDNSIFSTENILSGKALENLNYNAVFELKTYSIQATSSDEAMGTVSKTGNGTYSHFDQITLTASETLGYEFRYWKTAGETDDTLSFDKIFTFTTTRDLNCLAVFTVKRNLVNIEISPIKGGSVSGSGLYEHGSSVSLQATTNNGYTFTAWKDKAGTVLNTTSAYRFTVKKDTTLIAKFTPNLYNITLTSDGGSTNGEISMDGSIYSTSMQQTLPYDSSLTFHARPITEGYKFTQWKSGAIVISTENPFIYTVRKDDRISAVFSNSSKEISATVKPSETAGKVTNLGNYESEYTAVIEAIPSEGYNFVRWENKEGNTISSDPELGIHVTKDSAVVAVFELQKLSISAISLPSMGGNTTITPSENPVIYNTAVSLSAQAAAGHIFREWREKGSNKTLSNANPYSFTATKSIVIEGIFDSIEYEISIGSGSQGSAIGGGTYKYHSYAVLEASPIEGCHFVEWQISESENREKNNPYRLLVEKDLVLTPIFDSNTYKTSIANPTQARGSLSIVIGGTTISNGTDTVLLHNSQVTCSATAKENYVFDGFFSKAGSLISKSNPFNIKVRQDTSLQAIFTPALMSVSAESLDDQTGYVINQGGSKQAYLSNVTLKAEAAHGYKFVKWVQTTDTTILFSIFPSVEFILIQDTSLKAIFEKNSYYVSCRALEDKSGIVKGDSLYLFGAEATIKATPANGYTFSHWTFDGVRVSSEPMYTWTIDKAVSAIAVFEPKTFNLTLKVDPSEYGYTTGEGLYAYGDTATVEVFTSTDFYFEKWNNKHYNVSTKNPYKIVITSDSTLIAKLKTDTLNVVLKTTDGGTVSGQGQYLLRSTVSLKATADVSYEFMGWQDEEGQIASLENPLTFSITEDINYTALFSTVSFEVSIAQIEGGSLIGAGKYPYMKDVVILAQADSVHSFNRWVLTGASAEDEELSSILTPEILSQSRIVYTVSKDLSIEAKFNTKTYRLVAEASPAGTGTFTGAGTFNFGATTLLTAIPSTHYHFTSWTLDGSTVSTKDTLSVVVTEDKTYVAIFEKNTYSITVKTYPSAGGIGTGGGFYKYGDTARISVALQPLYVFEDWTDDQLNTISTEKSFNYIVSSNNTLTASLSKKQSNESAIENTHNLKVYPIPASMFLYFSSDKAMQRIILYDVDGRIIKTVEPNNLKAEIQVETISSGIKFYRIEWLDHQVSYGKWIR